MKTIGYNLIEYESPGYQVNSGALIILCFHMNLCQEDPESKTI